MLSEQAALIEIQAAELERRAARIAALEALLTKPKKTSKNSSTPPSQDLKPDPGSKTAIKRRKDARRSRRGVTRTLTDNPDETIQRFAHLAAIALRTSLARRSGAAGAMIIWTSRRSVRM